MWRLLLGLLLIGAQLALWQAGPLFGIGTLALGAVYFLIFDRAWRTEQHKRERRARRTEEQEDQWRQQEEARRKQEKQRRQQHEREQEETRRWQERQRTGKDAREEQQREWWDILGTTSQATMEDVKRAYRDKVRQYHPDKVAGLAPEFTQLAEQRTRELNAALQQAKRHAQ